MQARDWEKIYRQKGDLRFAVLPKVKRAAAVFKAKRYRNILDLGCGTGRHSIFLAAEGFRVYATDGSAAGIDIAREKAESLGLDIRFSRHDMKSISFHDSFFDAVICTWTIYHGTFAAIEKTVREIQRVLAPGGTVITDFLSVNDSTYGTGREIERNTFIGDKSDEEDVPHHYSERGEVASPFAEFNRLKIRASSHQYTDDRGRKIIRKYFNVEAIK